MATLVIRLILSDSILHSSVTRFGFLQSQLGEHGERREHWGVDAQLRSLDRHRETNRMVGAVAEFRGRIPA
jgi:hypothetical protein